MTIPEIVSSVTDVYTSVLWYKIFSQYSLHFLGNINMLS